MPERQEILQHRPELTYRATKRPRQAKRYGKVRLCGLILVASCIALLFALQAVTVSNRGIQIDRIKREISDLQATKERLQLDVARLQSLNRVENIATTRLGMQSPTNDNMIILPSLDDQGSTVQVASASGKQERRGTQNTHLAAGGSKSPALSLGRSFIKWLWGERQVEAAEPQ
ncbi:MAG: cell division protein FtsL [Bacillota bacterium]